MDNVELVKIGAVQSDLNQVVDNTFKTFTTQEETSEIDLETFFKAYDSLYWTIPVDGVTNSHQYLVERSSEVYKNPEINQEIDLLLQEISDLREELLTANKLILELQTQ